MPEWTRVAAVSDVPEGTLRGVVVAMQPIVLANVDGDVYALEDQCSHQDLPISDGELDGGDVVCTYHGARFDACTGKNRGLPAIRPVKSYPVEVRKDGIYLEI